jgi:hypothetical protein
LEGDLDNLVVGVIRDKKNVVDEGEMEEGVPMVEKKLILMGERELHGNHL